MIKLEFDLAFYFVFKALGKNFNVLPVIRVHSNNFKFESNFKIQIKAKICYKRITTLLLYYR